MILITYLKLIALLTAAVGVTVYMYRGVLFGTDDGVVLINSYTAAVVFGATAIGSKILSLDYPIGARRFKFVQSYGSAGIWISYLGIVGIAALFGFLLYVVNIYDPLESEYSDMLYYCSHALVGLIAGAIVTMSWIVSSKL